MPRYGYHCPTHGPGESTERADWISCVICGERAKRDWSFIIDSSFEPYYAPSFGTVVKSRTHAKDLAKIASEEQTLKTGIPHSYEGVYTHDNDAVGIKKEELAAAGEEKRRRAVNGAAWSAERVAEIAAQKEAVTAARKAS